ncbi:MAG TPA: hypothetical protein PLE52_07900 [Paludibacteraceae bacterium]|nr:hypothetical protein [Paludibacteraceae bacterium]
MFVNWIIQLDSLPNIGRCRIKDGGVFASISCILLDLFNTKDAKSSKWLLT